MVGIIYGKVLRYGRVKIYTDKFSGEKEAKRAIFVSGIAMAVAGEGWKSIVKGSNDVYVSSGSDPDVTMDDLASRWGGKEVKEYKGMINYEMPEMVVAMEMSHLLPMPGEYVLMVVRGKMEGGWFEWTRNHVFQLYRDDGYFRISGILNKAFKYLSTDRQVGRDPKQIQEIISSERVDLSPEPDESGEEETIERRVVYYVRANGVDYGEFDNRVEAEKFRSDLASGVFARTINAGIVKEE